jgi:hypothetical protein
LTACLRLLLIALCISVPNISDAADASGNGACVSLDKGDPAVSALSGAIRYHEDPGAGKSIKEILDNPAVEWKHPDGVVPSFGFSNSAFWLNIVICSSGRHQVNPVLEIAYPLLDHVQVFGIAGGKTVY